jgi:hypothetical protein
MTISHRSVLTENANFHALNHRLAQRIRDLEDRPPEMLGQQAFERSGLGSNASANYVAEQSYSLLRA